MRDRLMKLFSSISPELEVNLMAYGYGILIASGVLIGWCISGPRDGNFVAALGLFLTAITGGLFKRGSAQPEVRP